MVEGIINSVSPVQFMNAYESIAAMYPSSNSGTSVSPVQLANACHSTCLRLFGSSISVSCTQFAKHHDGIDSTPSGILILLIVLLRKHSDPIVSRLSGSSIVSIVESPVNA